MANDPYIFRTLGIQGFRAYLHAKTFDLSQKRNLGIFAPNGSGKTGVIDALEFVFSKEGTLERLGTRTVNNQAGFSALAHNLAEAHQISPQVSFSISRGKEKLEGIRNAGAGKRPQPAAASTVQACLTVNPIISGHALRSFVETYPAEQRYAAVATWLQLGPLVDVQKNLRVLRQQMRTAVEDTSVFSRIDSRLAKATAGEVAAWSLPHILQHLNAVVIAPLDEALHLEGLGEDDTAYVTLSERATSEEQQIGLAGLRQLRASAAGIYECKVDGETGVTITAGAICAFEEAVASRALSAATEAAERGKAASAAFSAIWEAAKPLFADDATAPDACPVCATPLTATQAGDAEGVRNHLIKHIDELKDYAQARKALDGDTAKCSRSRTHLIAALTAFPALLSDRHDELKAVATAYLAAVELWTNGIAPNSAKLATALCVLVSDLDQQIAGIEARQGDHTYAKAKTKVDNLRELQSEHQHAGRTKEELERLSQSLTSQAAFVGTEIRDKVQALLDTLQVPMNEVYRQIQGDGVAPIRLELPPETDTNQQRLNLVIDFAKNRLGVQPSGYLSDSQIHSVALAFRIAAIKRFNNDAPIVALDDIVTSYDADHRRNIVGMIARQLGSHQVILVTHDERFFCFMQDQLAERDWQFKRIFRLDADYGPRFADHKVSDEMIDDKWKSGESAANEIRQAEEEWLLKICRDFGVSVTIRSVERAYDYERSELACALAGFLKDAGLSPPSVDGVNNRFLSSLTRGVVENFGSHFRDNPYGAGSIGDERARWKEFQTFRDHFVCPDCKRTSFKRPHNYQKPTCAHRACEAQFKFTTRTEKAA